MIIVCTCSGGRDDSSRRAGRDCETASEVAKQTQTERQKRKGEEQRRAIDLWLMIVAFLFTVVCIGMYHAIGLGLGFGLGLGAMNCSGSSGNGAANGVNSNSNANANGRLGVRWWGRSVGVAGSAAKKPQNQNQSSSLAAKLSWRRKLLIMWIMFGVCITVTMFCTMRAGVAERRKEMLVSMCDERARMLQDQFAVSVNHVHALALLVSTFHLGKQPSAIDQKTFAEYAARTAFERPLTSGVSYAQKVLHSEREAFEARQGWKIKQMKTKEISPVQDEYAPVIFSQDTVSYIQSLDMMSGKEDRENILRARATGKGVLTSPFTLESNHLGVVLTFTVYNKDLPPEATPEERIEATAGYLGGAFDVESLVENLLHQLSGKQSIIVNVFDITNASVPVIMYGPPVTHDGLSHVSPLDFGDPFRKHQMLCRFTQEPPLPWSTFTSPFGVLVIFLLVGQIFHATQTRIAKVEEDYRKMEELKMRAEAADIAKSQFLATVSHEIRTPMNGVLGMLQMLMDTELDATQQDYARTAQDSGKALIALINEVLDQAKIESGRLELEAVPFDVRAILDDVLSLFSGKSRDKGIELAVYISERVPQILVGDPGRFRQIVMNLVGNSVKFTESGHIFVCVRLVDESVEMNLEGSKKYAEIHSRNTLSGKQAADGRNCWENFKQLHSDRTYMVPNGFDDHFSLESSEIVNLCVSVEDTGVGIPLKAQERVFTPFMQADSSTSRTYGGTGIGLSISRCLVELMGGKIDFVSIPDIGSTFTFTVVFRKGSRSLADIKLRQSENLTNVFNGMRALVVDGRLVRAEVTKYHLKRLGVQVDVASDLKTTVAAVVGCRNGDRRASSNPKNFNMVLVDKEAWGPGSGLTIPKLLKESRQAYWARHHSELPKMILLATSITPLESETAKTNGFVDTVIMKPLRASMVAACLQQALGLGNKGQGGKGSSTLQCLLSGKNILVVDDNGVNRRVAAGALKKYGANVRCAESGKAALEFLHPPHDFDACFMDVQMPEMDGFEATRQVRNLEAKVNEANQSGASDETQKNISKWHVPILAMTADVIQATHEECSRCGMDGYVSKPFEEEQLYRAVAGFFESKLDTTNS
eukprot:TRINITY_DN1198_c0_g1_i2.p1 TRINITY_DN1198_c0_g1~~TRINITY_DN1198_c0_g1_i2.p1  ORF type:complete len:1102 (+),score=183.66 TRINITY_DN1198_c0_g1_i2:334-3639(+)